MRRPWPSRGLLHHCRKIPKRCIYSLTAGGNISLSKRTLCIPFYAVTFSKLKFLVTSEINFFI
jgi:hypothetical protein